MLILWIRKKKTDQLKEPEKQEEQSFEEHDNIMKRFRLAHPDVNLINTRDILTAEGNVLAPIRQVKLSNHVQN